MSAVALAAGGCAAPPDPDGAPAGPPEVEADWSAAAFRAIAAGEYAPQPDGDGFRAANRAQRLRARFDARGVAVADRAGAGEIALSLRAWGREGAASEAGPVAARAGACASNGARDALGACVRRVEYARPGVTEWWENRPEGLEQGFTVTSPPSGPGALVFDLAVAGAQVRVRGEEATLVRAAGGPLAFGALAAWDATGRALPAWMEEAPGGVRLVVDDDGAVGSITVDPLLSAASWAAEADQAGAAFGASVAAAGDVNGDGFGDVIVGAPDHDQGQSGEGRAFLYLGGAAGPSTVAAWAAEANQAAARFGAAVAGAGDVNGDGYGDVVVGAPGSSGGAAGEGSALLYFGGAAGLSPGPAWTTTGGQAGAGYGTSVAAAGDVNGDGFGDLIVGAPGAGDEAGEGRAVVYLGGASGPGASPAWTDEPDQPGAAFGAAVAAAGDVNGDGFGDLVVGAPGLDDGETDEGGAFLYLGGGGGPAATSAWVRTGDQAGAALGASVATAGDVNGDGHADVLVGAPGLDDGEVDEGGASVHLGGAGGLSASPAWTATGGAPGAAFGAAVAAAVDVNGDGFGDVIVGASGADDGAVDAGATSAFLGGAGGLSASPAWTSVGSQAGAASGAAVAAAGDVNGDGYGDVIVGAPGYDGGEVDEGRASLTFGSASGLSDSAAWSVAPDQSGAGFGHAVASAGDVNGDGFGDLIVGAPDHDGGELDEGRAFLFLGSGDGPSATAAWTAEPDQAGAGFGRAVASAGDVNGDGFGDVVVGAPSFSAGEPGEGRAFVYLGGESGLSAAPAWTAESDQASARFGASVAGAGDVNGDGFGDLVVGAPDRDQSAPEEGRAYLFLGGDAGPSATPDWTADSGQGSAFFGRAVASAGDVNGDGFGDVAIGAPQHNGGEFAEGRVSVYLGGPTGLGPSAAWTAEPNQFTAFFGSAVASAGDVNGDGFGDLIVGAPNLDDGEFDEGAALVYLGGPAGLSATAAWTVGGDQAFAVFGTAVASAGDVNGDGYGDVVVGAPDRSEGESYEGRASVYVGGPGGLSTAAAWTAEANQSGARFGGAVASAGDVNGDGYGDVLIGSPSFDGAAFDGGRALVYLGNSADGTAPRPSPAQARQPGARAPIAPGLASVADDGFDVAMGSARTAFGAGAVALEVEVKPLGTPFDGSGLLATDTAPSGAAGVDRTLAVTGLPNATGHHWRARVRSSPAEGRPQGWGRWVYGGASGDAQGGHVFTAGYTLFADRDEDGFGDGASPLATRQPAVDGFVAVDGDCDDEVARVNPGASEVCDPFDVDEDCDGRADDADPDATVRFTYFADDDGDGYGGPSSVDACSPPAGYLDTGTDCDDGNPDVNPGAIEVCDPTDTDEDCDGRADDGDPAATGRSTFYADADGDGHGGSTTGSFCDLPAGYLPTSTDCDDGRATVNPGAAETPGDGLDGDCDGTEQCLVDADQDGYVDARAGVVTSPDLDCADPGEAAAGAPAGDCDDTNAAFRPGAPEEDCTDPNDYDCDGTTTFADDDDDGVPACEDCDDRNAAAYPGAAEVPGDGVDQDCDGADANGGDDDDDPLVDSAPSKDDEGCGCASRPSPAATGWMAGLAALVLGRRRRP